MSQCLHIKKQRFAIIFVKIVGVLGIFLSALFVSPYQIYAAGSCSQVTVSGQESINIVADPGFSVQSGSTTLRMTCTIGVGSSEIPIPANLWNCDVDGKNCWTQITPTANSNNCSKYNVRVDLKFPGTGVTTTVCNTTYNVAVTSDTYQNVQLHCGTLVSDTLPSPLPPPSCHINGQDIFFPVLCGLGSSKGSPCCDSHEYCAQYNSIQNQPVDPVPFDLCAQTGDSAQCSACKSQYTDDKGNPVGLWTAIGCIDPTKEGITISAIKLGLGIGGGVVLLMILAASFKLTTSKGDPKATEEAKEMITNAIGGLLFIIFSVVLVQTIGKGLLQIPGF